MLTLIPPKVNNQNKLEKLYENHGGRAQLTTKQKISILKGYLEILFVSHDTEDEELELLEMALVNGY